MLKAAYDAVKAADPRAVVIASGLNTGGGGRSWDAQAAIYKQLDAQGLGRPFDEIAVHIYTRVVGDALKVARKTRAVAKRFGDGARPIRVTELAWPAAKGKLRDDNGRRREFFAATSDKGMAKRLDQGRAAPRPPPQAAPHRRRRLVPVGVVLPGTDDAFRYSGLRRVGSKRLIDRPAMRAFKSVARSCVDERGQQRVHGCRPRRRADLRLEQRRQVERVAGKLDASTPASSACAPTTSPAASSRSATAGTSP